MSASVTRPPALVGAKSVEDSRFSLSEIVGEESLVGQRLHAGPILSLLDVVAGDVSWSHAEGPAVTLSFDRVDLIHPILHQDLVRLDGSMLAVGRSSMQVLIRGSRKDPYSRSFSPIQQARVTFVAVDAEGRPNRNIPALEYRGAHGKELQTLHATYARLDQAWKGLQQRLETHAPLRANEVEEPLNAEKNEFLTPQETKVEVGRHFMPRHLNQRGTIFGGDILLWMDRVAIYTARQFTRNPHMVTIAMNRIYFKAPVFPSDRVDLSARVVYVRQYTLEVEISMLVLRPSGERVSSHSGYFTVFNYDPAGFKRPILTGLRLADADQDGLLRYYQAQERHRFWRDYERDVRQQRWT